MLRWGSNAALRLVLLVGLSLPLGAQATPPSPAKTCQRAKPANPYATPPKKRCARTAPVKTPATPPKPKPPVKPIEDGDEIILEDETPSKKKPTTSPVSRLIRSLFTGRYATRLGLDLSFDGGQEDIFEWRNRFELTLSYDSGGRFKVFASTRFTHWLWLEEAAEPGDLRPTTERAMFLPELREAYALWRFDFGMELAVGQRILSWGRTTFTRPLDVLTPIDLQDGPVTLNGIGRLGVFSVEASQTIGDMNLSLVWIPFFRPHRVQMFGSDWSMLKPPIKLPIPEEYTSLLGVIHPTRYEEMQGLLSATEDPAQDGFRGADVGFRFTASFGSLDIGLAYAYQWDKMPMVDIDADLIQTAMLGVIGGDTQSVSALRNAMQIRYERRHVIGADFSFLVGDFTFKADVAFFTSHTLYTEDLDSLRHPSLSWAFQIDYMFKKNLIVSLEFSHQAFFGVASGTKLLFFDENLMRLSGVIEARFGPQEMFRLQVGGMVGITQKDAIITPRFTWRQSGLLSLDLGAVIFLGDDDIVSVGALFKNASYGYASARFSF